MASLKKSHHPSSIQWQTLIDIMEPLAKRIKPEQFNMMEGSCHNRQLCKTVLCVGGWAEFMLGKPPYDYLEGADKLAAILGFKTSCDLEQWAFANPDRWLNTHGLQMFSGRAAYVNDLQPRWANIDSLSKIITHWKMVRDLQLDIEEKKYKPFNN